MIPHQLDRKFSEAHPYLVELKKHVTNTLAAFADSHNYPYTGRIKAVESISEKIEMGRYARFSEIDDLVAFTLVIPSAAVEPEIKDFCNSKFDVVRVRDKQSALKRPDVFRFDSTRVIARARRSPDLGDYKGPSICDYLFEIQVRTAFEHAWSVATHDLVYKAPAIDWKRIRLAAQLKASSEGLDAAVAAFDGLAAAISESSWPGVSDQIAVSKFIELQFAESRLPGTLRPASISRFSENFYALVKSIQPSRSVQDCLDGIAAEMKVLNKELIPNSLSLYQFFLGLLCRRGLASTIKRCWCHITPELLTIFPETREIGPTFDYDT